jgi:hypothetical protein
LAEITAIDPAVVGRASDEVVSFVLGRLAGLRAAGFPGAKKAPPCATGPNQSSVYFDINTRAPFPSNFHIRFSHTPTLLDCYIGFADALPDRDVGGTGAVFAA